MHARLLTALALGLLASCNDPQPATDQPPAEHKPAAAYDIHTLSNADSISIPHLDLDIVVDFEQHQISGLAAWQIQNTHSLPELRLDTKGLSIDSVRVDGVPVSFRLGAHQEHLGSALHIPIQPGSSRVQVYYRTGKDATALKWLEPQLTAGRKHPYLYTQSEAVNARSWVPCPDGPGIRYTYNARVQVPPALMALMSAENPQHRNDSGIYHYRMPHPIPAYLMALAVGDLQFKAVDGRTGVYTEPSMLDKVHYELADLGRMVETCEQLYGPYRWGRYDVLVLPPSFPIGGMENPMLTFATPTIIAGDRSLVNLIAHELAHNWSGNLVTCGTWDDIWINEGFTVYLERRITEAMNGKSYVDMLWELGYQDLEAEVAYFGATDRRTWLKQDLKGLDPDEGLSDIPYEKGSLFLWLTEREVGRAHFDAFLKKYFDTYAFKSITTEQFLAYMKANLIQGDTALERRLTIDQWVYGPGIPANAPRAERARFNQVDSARTAFLNGASAAGLNTKSWTTHEWLHFLRKMPKPLILNQMQQLDQAFGFTRSGNSEIADQWFVMAIAADYKAAYPAMEQFLSRVGRQKFLEPLYREMLVSGKGDMARSLLARYRNNYHPLAQGMLDRLVQEHGK